MKATVFFIPLLLVVMYAAASCSTQPSRSSVDEVWQAYDAFNAAYLDSVKYIYKNTNRDSAATDRWHGAAAIWCQPMYVDMAMNAASLAARTGDKAGEKRYKELAKKLLEGNIGHYTGFDFDDGNTNTGWFIYDDIQWWTITLARAAKFFDEERYRAFAAKSFARVWYGSPRVGDTGSYADPSTGLGGGMFWQWQPLDNPNRNAAGDGKMSCINFPTVVAALSLYEISDSDSADPDPLTWINDYGRFVRPAYESKQRYLEMAQEIYDWSVANLTDTVTGMVHDHRHGDRTGGHPLLYNQGTYIGASVMMSKLTGDKKYLDNAVKAADYCLEELSGEHGMLPWAHNPENPYDQGSLEQGIYPAIWAQYMRMLVDESGMRKYEDFIDSNIKAGWANRDIATGLCDGESWKMTPVDSIIGSYAASSIPALMLLFTD